MSTTDETQRPTPPAAPARPRRAVRSIGALAVALPVALAVALGGLAGLGAFTFGYGDGAAYLSNDPAACANCHVMRDHFDTWQRSGHAHVAGCNDCHLPPGGLGKWVTKMDNGFFHSLAFTTGDFAEPIRIKPRNRRVTQRACLQCHRALVEHMLPARSDGEVPWCVSCHGGVGHRGHDRAFVRPTGGER